MLSTIEIILWAEASSKTPFKPPSFISVKGANMNKYKEKRV